MTYQCCKIVGYFETPLVLNGSVELLHLDGLLASVYRDLYTYRTGCSEMRLNGLRDHMLKLPLYQIHAYPEGKDRWIWTASTGTFNPDARPHPIVFTKRTDLIEEELRYRTLNRKSGPERDVMVNEEGIVSETITFYAYGNLDGILDMLSYRETIGHMRSVGYGKIKKWVGQVASSMSPIDVVWKGGFAQRNIPSALCVPGSYEDTDEQRVFPPYFTRGARQEVIVPGQPCQINPEVLKTWTKQIENPALRAGRRQANFRRRIPLGKCGACGHHGAAQNGVCRLCGYAGGTTPIEPSADSK